MMHFTTVKKTPQSFFVILLVLAMSVLLSNGTIASPTNSGFSQQVSQLIFKSAQKHSNSRFFNFLFEKSENIEENVDLEQDEMSCLDANYLRTKPGFDVGFRQSALFYRTATASLGAEIPLYVLFHSWKNHIS